MQAGARLVSQPPVPTDRAEPVISYIWEPVSRIASIIFALYAVLPRMLEGCREDTMDRAMILDHLMMTRRHVAQGERHIARQRELIIELMEKGRDAATATMLLDQLEICKACTLRTGIGSKRSLRSCNVLCGS
jgi:hypothetical protein